MFYTAARSDALASDEVGTKPEFPCQVCGGRAYSWGSLAAQGISFTPEDASLLAKVFRFGFGTKLRARRCDDCGNIQIFAHLPKVEE